MKSHLKVKVFSLTTEMTYIRKQEEKWKNKARLARRKQDDMKVVYAERNFWSQRWHRTDLKSEARNAHLAHGALRGVPYRAMEYISYGDVPGYNRTAPDWEAISNMVERFTRDEPNRTEIMQRFGEWLAEAQCWYRGNDERIAWWNGPEQKAKRQAEAQARKEAREAVRKAKEPEATTWAVPDTTEAA